MGRLQEKERFPHDDGETWVVPFIFVSRNFCSTVNISKAQGFGFHHNHPLKRMEVDIFWIFGGVRDREQWVSLTKAARQNGMGASVSSVATLFCVFH